ncbi:Calcium/calmodulin-dependent/calcium-dependent protein kinase [Artemisia annua]|uniref:non-specific serine/threonine protein kinase n=1 Tax=Artemisia annua TaxID=35608 RepID=A0A2U1PEY2_ARTAN|nr:Calcium/calmodulin-dependent/calcium-dependent protein kinase [Artemisia annua]
MSLALEEYTGEESQLAADKNLFGKYEVGKLLGYGAFAKVYHGWDIESQQSVAIKAINKHRIIKVGLTKHIKREISAMRRLRHPNIVRLHEVLANQKKIYFVLEYAKGGELFSKVSRSRFSEVLSRRYFQQLISAIGYCHSRGVYHRDLKPENLLLDENWNLKVTDFGLSWVTEQVKSDELLHTMCGTPAYVAPEILAKKGYDGAKVDIWSCGIILYVLNAGYLPFNDPNLMVMYRKIYKGEFRVPRWTSPELKHFLSRLLDTNPHTRITVQEILSHPWFKIGYKEARVSFSHFEMKYDVGRSGNLNAFDIISFSSGYNLGGLFEEQDDGEMFLSAVEPQVIIERVAEVAAAERLTVVMRKEWCVQIDGGHYCNFTLTMEIKRLTDELVVVDVRWKEKSESEPGLEMWKDKIRPELSSLIYQPAGSVTSS